MESCLPWMILKNVPGIGNHLYKRLLERFETPERVFSATKDELLGVDGITSRLISNIYRRSTPDWIKKDLDLVQKKHYSIVTMANPAFPPLLHQIPDPPPFLYVFGTIDDIKDPIAVVGSRNATDYGIDTTHRLCSDLASLGMTIVSGMARGIDTAAHVGALSAKGKTVAVLGSGLERIYPRENRKLFYQIAENGAVISEFPLHEEPKALNFPQRNRIISGMSLGTVIVEAARKSGSLITARMAAEQGREVFAVPGSIQSFKSAGTHGLIKQGAKLVDYAGDIVEELSHLLSFKPDIGRLNPAEKGSAQASLSPDEQAVLNTLEAYPIHIDDLIRKTSLDAGKLAGILLMLEIAGLVRQSPGKRFSRPES